MSYMAYVPNLAVQGGLEEFGNLSLTSLCSKSESDKECEENELEVTSHKFLYFYFFYHII